MISLPTPNNLINHFWYFVAFLIFRDWLSLYISDWPGAHGLSPSASVSFGEWHAPPPLASIFKAGFFYQTMHTMGAHSQYCLDSQEMETGYPRDLGENQAHLGRKFKISVKWFLMIVFYIRGSEPIPIVIREASSSRWWEQTQRHTDKH